MPLLPQRAVLVGQPPLLVQEHVSRVGHGLPLGPPVPRPAILLPAARRRHPERFQAAQHPPPMARRQDVELQEPLLRELAAVAQGSVPRPQEGRGVLGQVEGEQPVLDRRRALWRLRHDAAISPLKHQEKHRNAEFSTSDLCKQGGSVQLASSILSSKSFSRSQGLHWGGGRSTAFFRFKFAASSTSNLKFATQAETAGNVTAVVKRRATITRP